MDLPKGPAVLWLDDLEAMINAGLTFRLLGEWQSGVPGRIVACTYGGKGAGLTDDSRELSLATEVLQHAGEVPLEATTEAEVRQITRNMAKDEARLEGGWWAP